MKYLVDSNVWLEAALGREFVKDAVAFLSQAPASELAVADFSLHAMGFYLTKKTPEVFNAIVADIVTRGVSILRLDAGELSEVTANAMRYHLDFDDAFVFTIADRDQLKVVSLDAHFDRTPRGRLTPAQALAEIEQQQR